MTVKGDVEDETYSVSLTFKVYVMPGVGVGVGVGASVEFILLAQFESEYQSCS